MGLHEFAWRGLNIVVYGDTPLLSARVEECIATVAPALRSQLDSFQVYEDALDYCKNKKNVSFIIVLENCKNLPLTDVFRELCKPFEKRGFSAFGVLLHEQGETIKGLKCKTLNDRILAYLPVEDFLASTRTRLLLDQLWIMFCRRFEESLLPQPLQETLFAIASEFVPPEQLLLAEKFSTLFCGRLNISWIDWTAIRWAPIVMALEQNSSKALVPHRAVRELVKSASFDGEGLTYALDSTKGLPGRISAWVHYLAKITINNTLAAELNSFSQSCNSQSPEILLQTIKLRDEILHLAEQSIQNAYKREGPW